jgi:ABC-type cobalamin/Fe3+-siderophores transport system ATPase subunit
MIFPDPYASLNPRRFRRTDRSSQRQRVGVAHAPAPDPVLPAAGDPGYALDVSIQVEALSPLSQLQRDLNQTYLVNAHDLGAIGNRSWCAIHPRHQAQGPPAPGTSPVHL